MKGFLHPPQGLARAADVNVTASAATKGTIMAPDSTTQPQEPTSTPAARPKGRFAERLAALRQEAREARQSDAPPAQAAPEEG